jgi:hypothetical protein
MWNVGEHFRTVGEKLDKIGVGIRCGSHDRWVKLSSPENAGEEFMAKSGIRSAPVNSPAGFDAVSIG